MGKLGVLLVSSISSIAKKRRQLSTSSTQNFQLLIRDQFGVFHQVCREIHGTIFEEILFSGVMFPHLGKNSKCSKTLRIYSFEIKCKRKTANDVKLRILQIGDIGLKRKNYFCPQFQVKCF